MADSSPARLLLDEGRIVYVHSADSITLTDAIVIDICI